MPRGIPNAKPDEEISIVPAATAAAIEANKPDRVPVKLVRNYTPKDPIDSYEILGWDKAPVMKKNAAGNMVEVEKGGFIKERDDKGRIMPAPPKVPGTGFGNKLWANTYLMLPRDEAKAVRKAGIGEYELAD